MTRTTVRIFGLLFLIGSIRASYIPKIVGGKNAVIKNFPYLVSLRKYGSHFCGGTIISNKHILTAAHCLSHYDSDSIHDVSVFSGTSRADKKGDVHKVLKFYSHPRYDNYSLKHFYDIAILILTEPIVFNKYQQKINLPKFDVQKYQAGYVVGWGTLELYGESPKQLQKVEVALLPSDTCQRFVTRELHEEQVCSFRTGTGTCHGDSGGPLVSKNEIVGIVSYTEGGVCGEDVPDVYTNVFAYKSFIESLMTL